MSQHGKLSTPSHWQTVRLCEIADVRLGRQRSPDRATGPHMRPYLRAANVTWSGLSLDDVKEMDFTPAEQLTYRLEPGDILLSEASGSPSEVGKAAIYRGERAPCFFQNTLIRVRPPESLVRFLHLHFVKDAVTGAFATASRGVGIHHLGSQTLERWEIALPPQGEQTRIVDAVDSHLSRLDAAVASLEAVQRKLKAYRASVLKAAVEGRLVPTEAFLARAEKRDYEPADALLLSKSPLVPSRKRAGRLWGAGVVPELSNIERSNLPEGWCWVKVRDLGPLPDEVVQVGPMSMRSRDFADGGVTVLNVGCVRWGHIDDAKADKLPETEAKRFARYQVKSGDVLFTRSGTVGRSAVVGQLQDGSLITFHLLRARPSPDRCVPEYLQFVFQGASHVRRQTREASIGTTRAGFNTTLLATLDVPLPPLVEQHRIVAEVQKILSEIDACEATVLKTVLRCTRLRMSILKWAFEGRLVDRDYTDEPGEALLARIRTERAAVVAAKKTNGRRTRGAA